MSETIAPVSGWSVKCSQCSQRGPVDDSISRAVQLGESAGWAVVEVRGQLLTLCPDCVERPEEWAKAPAIEFGPEVQP